MPPFLKKQVFGLPAWAWIGITTVALGAALYARSKAKANKSEDTGDVCDPESESYDPVSCEQGSETKAPTAGYDSADPCDPTSVTYDPASCQASAGIGYESAGAAGGGGYSGGYGVMPEYNEVPSAPELSAAEQGGVNITAPLIEQNITEVKGGKKQSACKPKNKPKAKKGYRVVCQSGKWHYEAKAHAGKKKKKNKTHRLTGGGAPNRKNDKLAV